MQDNETLAMTTKMPIDPSKIIMARYAPMLFVYIQN